MNYIFIRNDDVRNVLDESLVKITDLCIKKEIPICHTVEPANVSKEVIEWLLAEKKKNPDLIEIVQHGYSHRLNYQTTIGGKIKKGEFGGSRTYEEQYADIKKGKDLMYEYFGDLWFPLFTFPYGARNQDSLRVLQNTKFLAVNGSMGISNLHKLYYFWGRLFDFEMFLGRKISYNLRYKKGTNLFQIDTAFSVIKKYLDDDEGAIFYSLKELKTISLKYISSVPNIGIVLHHRYHNNNEKIQLIEDFFNWLKRIPNIQFVTQEFIYKHYGKNK
jgi:hypothetical protein